MPRPTTCPAAKGVFKSINHTTSVSLFENAGMILLSIVFAQHRFVISHNSGDHTKIPTGVATTKTGKQKNINPGTMGDFRTQYNELYFGPDKDIDALYSILKNATIRAARAFQKKWGAQNKGHGSLLQRVQAYVDTGFPLTTIETENIATGDICKWIKIETGGEGEEEEKLVLHTINDKDCKQFSIERRWLAAGNMADNVCKLMPKSKGTVRTEMVCADRA